MHIHLDARESSKFLRIFAMFFLPAPHYPNLMAFLRPPPHFSKLRGRAYSDAPPCSPIYRAPWAPGTIFSLPLTTGYASQSSEVMGTFSLRVCFWRDRTGRIRRIWMLVNGRWLPSLP